MKKRNTCIAAGILAVMTCSAAPAQVLGGGNVGGALNGTLGGGVHDTTVLSNGSASGSFGGEFDTGPITRSTMGRARGVADETTHRARDVRTNVRNRAESTATSARDTKKELAPKVGKVTKDVNGSVSGNASASRDGIVAAATADAASAATMDAPKQAAPPASQPSVTKDTSKL